MVIYKFGGASIADAERIKQTAQIIQHHSIEKRLIVISAMGKTTNALEKVAESFFAGNRAQAAQLFENIRTQHDSASKYLCALKWKEAEEQLNRFYTELEWVLHDEPQRDYDYYYDQIVCCGEMLSSTLVYTHLLELGANACWIDVRDIIHTDNHFREPQVDIIQTEKHVHEKLVPLFEQYDIIITQGFVGCTDENESTTLGREGSDYTAALLANSMNAESVTIWKDVESVMSADPRKFPEAQSIPHLSYAEVIEMAFYGAQVIHPKTIKPLQNKNIPLYVKSFLDTLLPGTIIDNHPTKHLPPIIVLKEHQALITFTNSDFSFMEDGPVQKLHELFALHHLKPNLSQRTAISLLCCFDNKEESIHQLAADAGGMFEVSVNKNLALYTVRHHIPEIVNQLMKDREILVEQKTQQTMQWVCDMRPTNN